MCLEDETLTENVDSFLMISSSLEGCVVAKLGWERPMISMVSYVRALTYLNRRFPCCSDSDEGRRHDS